VRLTDFTDYSLRVLIYLNHSREPATLRDLSGKLGVSRNNLIQVSNRLVKLGYVSSSRGRSGGLRILETTGKERLGDIVRNTEEAFQMAECFSGKEVRCPLFGGCQLQASLGEALDAFLHSLDQRTLNDITPKAGHARE
jgi:Rrf2 family nitric oxide-sensitive transcriptional repressor